MPSTLRPISDYKAMLVESIKEMEQRMVIHLVYGVHNLYEHCDWALQDLLGIHEYTISIEIEYKNSR